MSNTPSISNSITEAVPEGKDIVREVSPMASGRNVESD